MNPPVLDWTDANQCLLAAELAWLKHRLESDAAVPPEIERRRVEAAEAMPAPAAIDLVTALFGLSAFERSLLLLCAGVELDAQLAAECAQLQSPGAPAHPTFGLALGRLPDPHWSALTPAGPLRRWRLLEVEPGLRLVDSALRIDERILHLLGGINLVDIRLRPLLTLRHPPRLMGTAHAGLVDLLMTHLCQERDQPALILLDGHDVSGQQDVAAAVAARLNVSLFVLEGDDLPPAGAELEQLQILWEREAHLLPALLMVLSGEGTLAKSLRAFAERAATPLIVAAREPLRLRRPVWTHTVEKPVAGEQKELWLRALGEYGERLNGALDTLAGQFRLSADTITTIADTLEVSDPGHGERGLWDICRRLGRERLEELAERVDPVADWDDLVLPAAQLATLRQIATHLRQRLRVYQEWGFARHISRGLGVSALFCGESGTGKTLAAEVMANGVGLDLYRIDLSAVVSKYIGETEKNLRRVFDAAEDSGAILLFDEADALFGKRSEVKDSHDRYANIEISYLLQRMEAYRGLAILTTNMKTALDRAFQRRLRFIVHFPFPDAELREAIWRRVFPAQTPLDGVDYRKLAKLNLPGGNIRNIALNAAFLAADAGESLAMVHLLRAAQSESAKLERPLADTETRGWV
jgi:hypothetical protein